MRLAIAVVMVLAGTAHAEDVDESRDVGLYVLAGGLAANTAFTIYNLATIGEPKSGVYAFGETLLTVPQTIVFGGVAMMTDEGAWKPALLAAWTAALAVHGIYTLARGEDEGDTTVGRTVMISIGERF
jgi:TctA family transporter